MNELTDWCPEWCTTGHDPAAQLAPGQPRDHHGPTSTTNGLTVTRILERWNEAGELREQEHLSITTDDGQQLDLTPQQAATLAHQLSTYPSWSRFPG